ncbi:VP24 [Reston ebolavirus - Reston]|uniref:Membrane-associated protein VP24 n=4 Tax=Reston ebolavirus TaxID=186539 RepID=VP24_EBORE|nr:membrane-associated protein [Reston ebolavirus]Q77DB4.1 RecName: Full=Membrane-associated protein VP24; AltName: Full=Reston VP24; Short=rVP24 [Reston ebolavirus - Reston (1989)]Q91DD5.1 RecName: Full=Membrane-associated protein VP24; AltName: Full=Reston VP24; Short=rVP24 [Reston ebolavirus - Reston]UJP71106.1 viral protein 24 [synthetic construct]AAN04453.1 membrane-associated protein VP24 [Reston ebolavirus]AAV48580.1 membrane-associated protein VP24 [Reston ebolavirus]ACT22805.1 membra
MAKATGRYNLVPPKKDMEKGVIFSDLCNFLITQTLQGWKVYWAGIEFDVSQKGMALLTRLKTNDFAPAWAMTRNLFPHLFQNPNSVIQSPIWALRVILAAGLQDQLLDHSLVEPLTGALGLISDWLLTTTSTHFNLRTRSVKDQLSLRMLSLIRSNILQFINKLDALHVVNYNGLLSSIEIGTSTHTIIITRTNMGFLVEVQEPDKSAMNSKRPGPVKFSLLHESAFKPFTRVPQSGMQSLIMEFNSLLAI